MVDSPFHYFSRLAEDRVNINENRATEIAAGDIFNAEYTANFNAGNINWSGTPLIYTNDSDWDYYGGCEKCYEFSMLFGGVMSKLGKINSDEEFEKYKTQFVEHYNKEHRDLYKWRKNKNGEKPITSKEGMDRLRNRSSIGSATTVTVGNSTSFFISSEVAYNSVFYNHGSPVITAKDKAILDIVAERGEISSEDKKRIEKKYGKSVMKKAIKKYGDSVMSRRLARRLIRRGWRE